MILIKYYGEPTKRSDVRYFVQKMTSEQRWFQKTETDETREDRKKKMG